MDQQHPDLEPLLLTMTQRASALSALLDEPDTCEGHIDAFAAIGRRARKEGPQDPATVGERQLEVLEDGQVLENRRPLQFAPDAEIGDFGLVKPVQIGGAAE